MNICSVPHSWCPVTDQGVTSRAVYLPTGADWYNYCTNERFHGGQTINVAAPIDTLPLFVRSGSILPLGEAIQNTNQVQAIAKVRVFPGTSSDFTIYQDDGKTYAYEKGESSIMHLHWDDAARKLSHEGPWAWKEFGFADSGDCLGTDDQASAEGGWLLCGRGQLARGF